MNRDISVACGCRDQDLWPLGGAIRVASLFRLLLALCGRYVYLKHVMLSVGTPAPFARQQAVFEGRRRDWLRWRSQRFAALPEDRLWLLWRSVQGAKLLNSPLGRLLAAPLEPTTRGQPRQRDLYPLGPVPEQARPLGFTTQRWSVLRVVIDAIVSCLNWLYAIPTSTRVRVTPTAAQSDLLGRLTRRTVDFIGRLHPADDLAWRLLLPDWVSSVTKPPAPARGGLVADLVDNLAIASGFNPQPFLPPEVLSVVTDPAIMFPSPPGGLEHYESVPAAERVEYIRLTVTEPRAGKLRLVHSPRAGGTVFAVGKPGGSRQREILHGQRASRAAIPPPRPPNLCCPTALTTLESSTTGHLRVSKRDAKCWFDQLLAPDCLRQFLGRPRVSGAELRSAGVSASELRSFLEPLESPDNVDFAPFSRVWPMGFSWSSTVAQHSLLKLCAEADLTDDMVLTCDKQSPISFDLVFGAATDDVMIFQLPEQECLGEMRRNLMRFSLLVGCCATPRRTLLTSWTPRALELRLRAAYGNLVFVLSEDNPSDGASQGVRRQRDDPVSLDGPRARPATPDSQPSSPRTQGPLRSASFAANDVEAYVDNDTTSNPSAEQCCELTPDGHDPGRDTEVLACDALSVGRRGTAPGRRILVGLPEAPPWAGRPAQGSSTLSKMWRPRALIICSGTGPLGTALRSRGWHVDEIDVCLGGSNHNLLCERVRRRILGDLAAGRYHFVHCSPPCASHSPARCPPSGVLNSHMVCPDSRALTLGSVMLQIC